jgi:hypothetical protein
MPFPKFVMLYLNIIFKILTWFVLRCVDHSTFAISLLFFNGVHYN